MTAEPDERAWVLLPSGRRLNLLAPDAMAWTHADLAMGLSRTYRWAGYSAWDLPLSVAQHSLTVLRLCDSHDPPLTPAEALRELLHDSVEALMGGWDPITPIKPYLGAGYAMLVARLQAAVDKRYRLAPWTEASRARHKRADLLAAASEAFHVAGWSRAALVADLGIDIAPLERDPLVMPAGVLPAGVLPAGVMPAGVMPAGVMPAGVLPAGVVPAGGLPAGMREWEPWPPKLAEFVFLAELQRLLQAVGYGDGDG